MNLRFSKLYKAKALFNQGNSTATCGEGAFIKSHNVARGPESCSQLHEREWNQA